jgi:tetratricopeptide (TPR) repeat protein
VAWRAGLAASLCWLDRRAEASSILDEASWDGFDYVAPVPTMLATLALYADAAAQVRHGKAAKKLYERMEPCSEQVVWMTVQGYGHVRLWLGLLADVLGAHEQADEHLGFACEFHEANDVPLWAARGHLGRAEALATRGDPARAREHATHAFELSREHGYGAFVERAAALIAPKSTAEADGR